MDKFNRYLKIIEDENQDGYYSYCDALKKDGLLPEWVPYPKFLCMNFPTKITLLIGLILVSLFTRIVYNTTFAKFILIMVLSTLAIFMLQGIVSTLIYYIFPLHKFKNNKKAINCLKNQIKKEKPACKTKTMLKTGQDLDFYLNTVKANTGDNQLTELLSTLISKIKESGMDGQKLYRYTNIYIKEISALIIDLETNKDELLYKDVYDLMKSLIGSIDKEREETVKNDKTNLDTLRKFMSKKGDI